MSTGFLKYGEGKVAESEYLETHDAGTTSLTPDEVIEWCQDWASDRVFLAVGCNCWTMVHDFLESHEGCTVTDSVKFKEEEVNNATQALIKACEQRADKEGRSTEDVMQDIMSEPGKLLPTLFTAKMMKEVMPDAMSKVIDKGEEVMDSMSTEQQEEQEGGSLGLGEVRGKVQGLANKVMGGSKES